ncbi:MAG: hypothetical protein A49_18360 [Methyloceanibacter sp.]|nr:MAG: hypothetical protein A49_18360 [Methyloceanibacter sp.]
MVKSKDLIAIIEANPDAVTAWAKANSSKINDAVQPFYSQYGSTLEAWGRIESGLSDLFAKITRMPRKRASKIFFSARSFNGRADMFEAALSAVRLDKETRSLLKTIIKKARTYSGFRNKLAHGQLNVFAETVDGDFGFKMFISEHTDIETGYAAEDLKAAEDLFRALFMDVLAVVKDRPEPSPETRRELILQRPNVPHSRATSRSQSKQRRPPRSFEA